MIVLYNYALKLIVHKLCLTVLLEYMTALLESIDLFVLDVVNVFQHKYYTSNQDKCIGARAPPSELHVCSYIMKIIFAKF